MTVEKQHSKIILNLGNPIYICDAQGYLTLLNKAAVELLGSEPEVGKDLYSDLFKVVGCDGAELPAASHPVNIAIKEHKPVENIEIIIKRQDGSLRNVLQSSVPYFNV
ncbi:MAG: hypothetical protein ABIR19_04090, partial [Ginsengibacter sp.]